MRLPPHVARDRAGRSAVRLGIDRLDVGLARVEAEERQEHRVPWLEVGPRIRAGLAGAEVASRIRAEGERLPDADRPRGGVLGRSRRVARGARVVGERVELVLVLVAHARGERVAGLDRVAVGHGSGPRAGSRCSCGAHPAAGRPSWRCSSYAARTCRSRLRQACSGAHCDRLAAAFARYPVPPITTVASSSPPSPERPSSARRRVGAVAVGIRRAVEPRPATPRAPRVRGRVARGRPSGSAR